MLFYRKTLETGYIAMLLTGCLCFLSCGNGLDILLENVEGNAEDTDITLFTGKQTVDSGDDMGQHTSIAADGANIYIAYQNTYDNDLRFTRSTDGGSTWPVKVTVDSTGSVGRNTSIAVNGSNVYISYYDLTNTNLKFARSTDGGSTWPTVVTVDNSADDVGRFSSIGVDGSTIYISYHDETSDTLMYAKSVNGGTS
jgi:hypothetical protein